MATKGKRWGVVNIPASPLKKKLARKFRRQPTPLEEKAWALLRNRNIHGMKFRRQQVIQGFIVDFYCAEKRMVLEIDGSVHDNPEFREYDSTREEVLRQLGIRIVRINNAEVSRANLIAMLGSV